MSKIPQHIAVIMDGNGRWAIKKNKPRIYGHKKGVSSVKKIIKYCLETNVKYLTLYAFSKENWQRPKEEVNYIFELFYAALKNRENYLIEKQISLKIIGDLNNMSSNLKQKIGELCNKTKDNKQLILSIIIDYSGRWEIVHALKNIIKDIDRKKLELSQVDETIFSKYLLTSDIPDPDILLRTGGEFRISNFLLWQVSYSEMFFVKEMWPDFNKKIFNKIILEYQNRERRFGKTTRQINNINFAQ